MASHRQSSLIGLHNIAWFASLTAGINPPVRQNAWLKHTPGTTLA
ncbi:MAG TPA: hypothetical protein VJ577_09675 [Burkholderiaceae bacterium]|nr:hypothetical protein [Burkholderiaceae bacterium]